MVKTCSLNSVQLSLLVIVAVGMATCTSVVAQTTAPADPLGELDQKIAAGLERKDISHASKDMVKALWADYRQAFEKGEPKIDRQVAATPTGNDVENYHDYIGRYSGTESEMTTALLEVVKDSKGRLIVKIEGHDIPAVADGADWRIIFTTGDIVPAAVPQLGREKHVTLEFLALTRVAGKFYLQSFGQSGPQGRMLFKLPAGKSAPAGAKSAPSAAAPNGEQSYSTGDLKPGLPTYTVESAVKDRKFHQAFRLYATSKSEPDNPQAFNAIQLAETTAEQGDADWGKILDDPTIPYNQKSQMIYAILDRRMGHCAVNPGRGGRGGRGGPGGFFIVGLNQPMNQQQALQAMQAQQAQQASEPAEPTEPAEPVRPAETKTSGDRVITVP